MTDQRPGPYWTRAQAAAAINGADGHADHAKRRGGLIDALNETGTKAGVFDLEILDWLAATWEPETVQVFIGLIRRARAAADAELQAEIDTLRAQVESLEAKVHRTTAVDPIPAALPEGARVSTRHGIGTVINPANNSAPAVAVELDVVLRNATVRTIVEPVGNLTRLDGTHAADRGDES